MSCSELQSEELEVLKSIYEGDDAYSAIEDTVHQYKVWQGLPRWRQKRLPFFIPGNCQKVDPQGGRFKMFDLFWSLEALGGLI